MNFKKMHNVNFDYMAKIKIKKFIHSRENTFSPISFLLKNSCKVHLLIQVSTNDNFHCFLRMEKNKEKVGKQGKI